MDMHIGDRIKFIRGNLTQGQFAEKIKVDQSTVQVWEGKNKVPKGDILKRIREAFGVSIDWLLTGEGDPYPGVFPYYNGADSGPGGLGEGALGEGVGDKELFGRTRLIEKQGKQFVLTEYGPRPGAAGGSRGGPGLGRAVDMLATVLDSGNPLYIQVVLSVLSAFSSAATRTKQQTEEIRQLTRECEELRTRLEALEAEASPPEKGPTP